jgi:hypothetical protein
VTLPESIVLMMSLGGSSSLYLGRISKGFNLSGVGSVKADDLVSLAIDAMKVLPKGY